MLLFQNLLSKLENFTPVKDACSSGEELIRDREEAPGCEDVKKQISLLKERQDSALERARARRDRLLGAADIPISEFRSEVRDISAWIQESWNVMSAILRGEGTAVGNQRKIEVFYRLPTMKAIKHLGLGYQTMLV